MRENKSFFEVLAWAENRDELWALRNFQNLPCVQGFIKEINVLVNNAAEPSQINVDSLQAKKDAIELADKNVIKILKFYKEKVGNIDVKDNTQWYWEVSLEDIFMTHWKVSDSSMVLINTIINRWLENFSKYYNQNLNLSDRIKQHELWSVTLDDMEKS